MLRFCKKMLQYYQYSIYSKYWLLMENTSTVQDNTTTIMLIWCLKQLKDFILKFSISGSFFSFFLSILVSFPSGDVLMRLPTVEQIIIDTNMIFISFIIIHWQPYISWIMSDFVKLYTFV